MENNKVTYFRPTTDASGYARLDSSAGGLSLTGTAVPGNIGDIMKNARIPINNRLMVTKVVVKKEVS